MTSLKKHILHLAQDEKFIDMGVNVFEKAYPQCNRLILVHKGKINHVTFENKNIITKKELVKKSKDSSFWKDVNTVIFHSLFTYNVTIPKGVKVIWLGFGFDYYDYIFSSQLDLYGNKTTKLTRKINTKEKIKTLIGLRRHREKKKRKFIERVDIFCPVLTTEYHAIKWPEKNRPMLMDWNYGTMEDNWGAKHDVTLSGNNILLGNSATHTCNHLEGIDLIVQKNNLYGDLIIPLSYGDKKYAQVVKRYAQKRFKGEVLALENFMPFDRYMQVISSCSLVIMPHKRQQGVGNIVMLINLGAKVFLDKDNLLYDYLKEKGFVIFTLEDVLSPSFQVRLTAMQIAINKKLLYETWGERSILAKTKALIEC